MRSIFRKISLELSANPFYRLIFGIIPPNFNSQSQLLNSSNANRFGVTIEFDIPNECIARWINYSHRNLTQTCLYQPCNHLPSIWCFSPQACPLHTHHWLLAFTSCKNLLLQLRSTPPPNASPILPQCWAVAITHTCSPPRRRPPTKEFAWPRWAASRNNIVSSSSEEVELKTLSLRLKIFSAARKIYINLVGN